MYLPDNPDAIISAAWAQPKNPAIPVDLCEFLLLTATVMGDGDRRYSPTRAGWLSEAIDWALGRTEAVS